MNKTILFAVYKTEFYRSINRRALLIIAFIIFSIIPIFVFLPQVTIRVGVGPGREVNVNSEIAAIAFYGLLNFLFLIFLGIITGALSAPTENKVIECLFTTRLNRKEFLLGKFLGGITPLLMILFFQAILFTIMQITPAGKEKIDYFQWLTFIRPFFTITIPLVFILGSIGFLATTATKKPIVAYGIAIFIFLATMLFFTYGEKFWEKSWLNIQYADITGAFFIFRHIDYLVDKGVDISKIGIGLFHLPINFILQRIGVFIFSFIFLWLSMKFVKEREIL